MPTTETESLSSTTTPLAYRAALDAVRAALVAMPESEVERFTTLDASAAAVIAEASANKVAPYRAALVAQFGGVARAALDELPVLARATRQADIELAASQPLTDLSALHEEVRAAYQLLITDADSLANRKLLDGQRLEAARDIQGYQALLQSTLVLVNVLRDRWSGFAGQTPLTVADLDRAEAAAQRMSAALGDRDNGVSRAPALELRARALSKLVRVYEEVRRMITYLRWHQDDVDAITPSLWASRGRRGRSRDVEPEPTPTDDIVRAEPATPVAPSPNNGGPPFIA
jgi:hypothetical protein